MKASARNRFTGTISAVRKGAVNDDVHVTLTGGAELSAVVTSESSASLGLVEGAEVVALVKAPWVMLVTEAEDYRFSARNRFAGTVNSLERGAVNTTVELAVAGGLTVVSVITNESADELDLVEGATATALFKASQVILAVPA
ncbi:MAG: TOBE domain-containing protein [Microbacterium sp.]|jgi:molybdate transport system regulatory protein|uniref:TOBE domain-containing protein n=1 Tax=Microbacterium sp. TaxID=51671 RepID=UPI002822E2CC|nr:TOBE domain-containing protein [Microbacterium sp.]MDR2321875.1 TOBE domain-containing protein [Microbacterium sp.]